ncbi:hypothetical protein LIER_30599 [Lithospermum erythrorhizon]|uniref:Uncharacterized protein n=1 Tax=Lithospermum erythrorhizon TaxID=34254 RepID=A0AAV3RQ47_LITER
MAESSSNPSSRPSGPSATLAGTLREGPVNIEAHATIRTPALESFHRRSTMEEAPEDFVGSFLRDSLEALPTSTSSGLDDSQGLLNVQPLRSRMGPTAPRTIAPKPLKGKSTK